MLKKRYFILLLIASFFIPRSFLSMVLSEDEKEVSLVSNLGNNKVFVDTYKAQCLKALSFYPELKDVNIEWKFDCCWLGVLHCHVLFLLVKYIHQIVNSVYD